MLKTEAKKFNPANIGPERFLLSPTEEIVGEEVAYLAKNVEKSVISKGPFRGKKKLELGPEFEVVFFTPTVDPHEVAGRYPSKNPNYNKNRHGKKMENILAESQEFVSANQGLFWKKDPVESMGRVMLEYRLAPFGLREYLDAIKRFRDHVVKIGKQFGVLPVVFSQHLHITLFDGATNILADIHDYRRRDDRTEIYRANVHKVFQEAAPLVQLPEEFNTGVRPYRHQTWKHPDIPAHDEFRLLSSEYACDPGLNALICLMALRYGLNHKRMPHLSPLTDNFEQEVGELATRQTLLGFMGQSLLSTLAQIVSQYPDVSRRKITVPELISSL